MPAFATRVTSTRSSQGDVKDPRFGFEMSAVWPRNVGDAHRYLAAPDRLFLAARAAGKAMRFSSFCTPDRQVSGAAWWLPTPDTAGAFFASLTQDAVSTTP